METPLSNIKNIIFDLGGVILDIDYLKTAQAFIDLGVKDFEKTYSQAKQSAIFDLFEKGQLSEEDFFEALRTQFGVEFSNEEMISAWNAMLISLPQHRLQLLEKVKQQYSIFLLSNTNETHIKAFEELILRENKIMGFEPYFTKVYYSSRVGKRKPDEEIFLQVINENNLNPKETLFIDDSIQHVKGAEKSGLNALHLVPTNSIEMLFSFL